MEKTMNPAEVVLKDGLEADVVVIAAGAAGLAASVMAAECGAKIIALEKSDNTGGTAKMGSGPFAVESRLQRLQQHMFTREEAFRVFMDWSHWRVNARLVKTFVNQSAGTIDWLEGMGVEFLAPTPHGIGNYATQHTVKGPNKGPGFGIGPAAVMMKILTEKAGQLGVSILFKTRVKEILMEGGRITGVIAEDSSREEAKLKAGAVIIATGGFSKGTPDMPEITGDGIRMAREIGADASKIPGHSVPLGLPPRRTHNLERFHTLMFAFQQPNLMVNLLGERFINEDPVINTSFISNAIACQKNGTAFAIFDEDTKKHYVEEGFDFMFGGIDLPIIKATDFDNELRQILDNASQNVFVADSLEDLANQTGIDLQGLLKTVDEYNRTCDIGRDEIFDRNPRYLKPVRQPKFYASKSVAGFSDRQYGIRINHKTEVMTPDFTVIPGLYAVGNDAASNIYHDTYPMVLPATAMGFALTSGRIAGKNAVKYLASIRQ